MARCADTRCRVDRFEAQAQADIAEVAVGPCAANEGPMIVELADGGKIVVQQLAKLI